MGISAASNRSYNEKWLQELRDILPDAEKSEEQSKVVVSWQTQQRNDIFRELDFCLFSCHSEHSGWHIQGQDSWLWFQELHLCTLVPRALEKITLVICPFFKDWE